MKALEKKLENAASEKADAGVFDRWDEAKYDLHKGIADEHPNSFSTGELAGAQG